MTCAPISPIITVIGPKAQGDRPQLQAAGPATVAPGATGPCALLTGGFIMRAILVPLILACMGGSV